MISSNVSNFSTSKAVKAKVELYEGSTLVETCTCGYYLQDFTVHREGAKGKFFGYGVTQKLNLNLIDMDGTLSDKVNENLVIKVCLGDGTNWDCPYPKFYVDELSIDRKNKDINIVSYDILNEMSKHTISELNMTVPYTVNDLLTAICNFMGLSLSIISKSTQYNFSLSYAKGGNYEGTETLKEVLTHIAEITGATYFVRYEEGTNGKLMFSVNDSSQRTVATVEKKDYYELITHPSRMLTAVHHITELGDNYFVGTETGVAQYIRNNPLIELRTDLPYVLNNIFNTVNFTVLEQYELDWSGNYLLEVGDLIKVETDTGAYITVKVANDKVSYGGVISEETSWEYADADEETSSNPVTLTEIMNKTFAKVDKVAKEITLYVGDIETTIENKVTVKVEEKASEIYMDVDSIEQRVTAIENTQTDVEGAVETVVNEKLAEINIEIDSIEQRVSEVETTTKTITTTIDTKIETAVEELEGTIDTKIESEVSTRVETTVTEKVAEINIEIDGIEQRVYSLENTTIDIDGKVETAVNEKFAEVDIDVDGIQQRVEQTETKVANLENRVTSNENETTELDGKVTTVTNEVGQLRIDSDNIVASVSSLEQTATEGLDALNEQINSLQQRAELAVTPEQVAIQISTALNDGVTSVTTSTGFTFNEDGLHISKTGSAMTSTLDENGLVVSSYVEPVLEATTDGVNALNLNARQYLKIGGSRFQSYGYNRTGCFWIGD